MDLALLRVVGLGLGVAALRNARAGLALALFVPALLLAAWSGLLAEQGLALRQALASFTAGDGPASAALCALAAASERRRSGPIAGALVRTAILAWIAGVLALPWLDTLLASAVTLVLLAGLRRLREGRPPARASAEPARTAALRTGRALAALAALGLASACFGEALRGAGFEPLWDATLGTLGLAAPGVTALCLGACVLLGRAWSGGEIALVAVPVLAPLALAAGADRLALAAAFATVLEAAREPGLAGLLRSRPPGRWRPLFPSALATAMFLWPPLAHWLPEEILR